MQIGILKEPEDKRVSIIPDSVKLLIDAQNSVHVEKSAGEEAFYADSDYKVIGAEIVSRADVLSKSDMIISISPVEKSDLARLKKSAVYILKSPSVGASR